MRKKIARKLATFLAFVVLFTTFGSDYNSIGVRATTDVNAVEQVDLNEDNATENDVAEDDSFWEPQGAEQQEEPVADEASNEPAEEEQPAASEEEAAPAPEPQVEEPQETPAEEAAPVEETAPADETTEDAQAADDQAEAPVETPTDETQNDETPAETPAEEPAADEAAETPAPETPAETPEGIVITYVAGEGGTVSAATETVTEAATGSTATADEGYEFANWTNAAGTEVGTEATLVPTEGLLVNGAVYTANFTKLAVEAEPEVDMPAVTFDDEAGDISVHVEAGEGAFPEGTVMKLTAVYDQAILDAAAQAAGVEADSTAAVDITFLYKDEDIEPEKPINVQLHSKVITEADAAQVVHISDEGDANVISDANINGDTAEFDSSDFSVYVVVGSDDDNCRVKVIFKNGDEEIASMYVKKDDDMEQVLYDPGVGRLATGVNFAGWSTDKNYEPDATGLTIEDVRNTVSGMLPPAIDADAEGGIVLEYYAMLLKQYKVTYLEKEVVLGEHAVNLRADATGDDAIRPYTVNMAYSVPDDEHKFEGWLVAEGNSNIVDRGAVEDGKPFDNGSGITIKGDVTFSVDAPEGHWLIFVENPHGAKGGTYCAPQFIKADEVTHMPRPASEMLRKGYDFGGWYTDEDCTDGNEFVFEQPLEEKTYVYAKWVPHTEAPYTILIWKQNSTKDGYDFAGSAVGTGTVGNKIKADEDAIVEKNLGDVKYAMIEGEKYGGVQSIKEVGIKHPEFAGFTLKKVEDATITAEGTGVANVYFDRVQYTLKMYLTRRTGRPGNYSYSGSQYAGTGQYGGAWNLSLNGLTRIKGAEPTLADGEYFYYPITAYYGDNISGEWPTYDDIQPSGRTFVSWLLMEGAKSYTSGGNGGNTVKGIIGIMDECVLADLSSKNGNYVVARYDSNPYDWTYNLYFADADGNYPANPNETVAVKSNQSGIDSQHAPPKDGYDYVTRDGYDANERTRKCTINYYYTPKKFAINFMDGNYVNGDENGGTTIQNNSGYQLHEEDDITYGADISSYGDYVPTCPEPGFVFEGWYMDKACTKDNVFDFNTTMPLGGVTLFAKWRIIQYRAFLHPNMEGAYWGSDSQKMDFRVDYNGKISSPTGTKAGYRFVGWYTTPDFQADSVFNGEAYALNEDTVTTPYPDDDPDKTDEDKARPWITKRFDIYAQWREVLDGSEGINVIYNLTDPDLDGAGHPGTGTGTAKDDGLYVDNSRGIAVPAVTAPEGYVFSNWVVQKYISGDTYEDVKDVFPGGSYDIKAEYAKVTPLGDGKNSYVIQLRAEYKLKEKATPTYIPWFANDNTAAFAIDKLNAGESTDKSTLQINEAVDIKTVPDSSAYNSKYEFKGWAKVDMGDTDAAASAFMDNPENWKKDGLSLFITYENGAFTYNGKEATQVAADEATPYQALYAVWKDKLIYHSNTDQDETDEELGDPETALTVAANHFTNGDYTFQEWNTKPDGTGTTYQPGGSYTLTEDVDELFAIWDDTLTYKANNGTNDADVVDRGRIGEELTVRPADTFTNGNYTFKEWNTKEDGSGDSYKPSESKYTLTEGEDVLYAIWEDTLTYKANTGTAVEDVVDKGTVGGKLTVKPDDTFTNGNYTFKEWNTEEDGSGDSYKNPAEYTLTEGEDVLYAIWEDTLTYYANNGTTDTAEDSGAPREALTVKECTFSETRYTFVEWNTEADGSGDSYKPNEDTYTLTDGEDKLFAIWKDTLTYKANTGTAVEDVVDTGKPGEKLTVKPDDTFTNGSYTFKEWNTKEDGSGDSYKNPAEYTLTEGEDVLYAIWEDSLTYKANNGSSDESVVKGAVNAELTVAECSFAHGDYEFVEWNTKADGSGDSYKPSESKYTLTEGEDVLYAIWKDKLVYKANNGTADEETVEGYLLSDVTVAGELFTYEGYKFVSWNTKADGKGTKYEKDESYTLSVDDDVLYAIWEKDPEQTYTIDYWVRNDGQIYDNGLISDTEDPSNYVHETHEEVWVRTTEGIVGSTAKPDGGYKFIGWYMYNDLPSPEFRGDGDGDGGYSGKLVTTDLILTPEKIASELEALFPDGIYQWTGFEARFAPSDDTYNAYYVAEAGGETTNPMDTDNVLSTEKITGSTAKPLDGYEFDGWYVVKKVDGVETDVLIEGAKEELTRDEVIANLNSSRNIDSSTNDGCTQPEYDTYEDTTFKAKFKAKIFNVRFEYRLADGVEAPANWTDLQNAVAANNRTAKVGETITCPELPVVEGYTFGPWNKEDVLKDSQNPNLGAKIINALGDLIGFITGKTDAHAASQVYQMPANDIVIYSIVTKNPDQVNPPTPDPPKPTPDDDDDDDDDTPRRRNNPTNDDHHDNDDGGDSPNVLGEKRQKDDDKAVLGAKREEEEKAVLGARRGGTEDATNTSRVIVLLIAAGAVATLLITTKKRSKETEDKE